MNKQVGPAFIRSLAVLAVGFAARLPARAQTSATGEQTQAMLNRVLPSVVRIEVVRLQPEQGHLVKLQVSGSGAIISAEGYVVTNCHVAEHGDYFRCYLSSGEAVEARRVGEDALTDLAVLKLDLTKRPPNAPPLPPAAFGDSGLIAAGDTVFALGSPADLSQSVTRGIVSNPSLVLPGEAKLVLQGEDVGTVVRWILHDASIFGGNSGGPLVNLRGEIIGINELGIVNLGGAIPGNLARAVADQLIAHGHVVRGWSGITVQPRLRAEGSRPGVIIADIVPASPADQAGLLPGDALVTADGHAIDQAEEKGVAQFNRMELGRLPGDDFVLVYDRAGLRATAHLKLAERRPAESDDVELRAWGAVARDLTPLLARLDRLPDTRGVVLASIRPAGALGEAEPRLADGDILVSVNGQPVDTVAQLQALTATLTRGARGRRTVLAGVRRGGALVDSVVALHAEAEREITPQARKAWLGVASQPLTVRLGARLAIKAEGGVRLTQVFPGSPAAAAGLQVGDVVLAVDGDPVTARRAEDADAFATQIRQYGPGSQATFTVWREGKTLQVPATLETQPAPPSEMPWWHDEQLEFAVRDLAFDDRVGLQLDPGVQGVLVESADMAGWAALAGLRAQDLILKAGGEPITAVDALRRARQEAVRAGHDWWVLLVQRRSQTLFVEINLKPLKS
jgi:serine protease Do